MTLATTRTDEERARAAALAEVGATAAHALIEDLEKGAGAADTIGVLSGVIDACACYIAAAAGPEHAVEILSDIGASLSERLREAKKAGH